MKSNFNTPKIRKNILFILFALVFALLLTLNMVQAASITTNITETNINTSVLLNGTGFSPNTNYSILLWLENKSSWWDGFDEQWSTFGTNVSVNNETGAYINASGYTLAKANFSTGIYNIIQVINSSNGGLIGPGNYTLSANGVLTNATALSFQAVNISYNYALLRSNTIVVQTDGNGNFSYSWDIPNDWRISGGKTLFRVGQQLASSLMWSTQGANWAAALPTKNGITGDNNSNGFIFTGSSAAGANQGGMEKFYKSNGSLACAYNLTLAENINDLANNGSLVYAVTSSAANNLKIINMSNCGLVTAMTTAGVASWSINVAPNNTFAIITYAANTAPRKYNITNATPFNIAAFSATAINSIAYDSCISPNSSVVYIGYANGNVTALNAVTGALIWNSEPIETELNDSGFSFPVNGLSCDDQRVYVAHSQVSYPAGIINQGFVEALWVANGSRAWVNSKTDTIYDGMDVNNIRCDANYCYAVKALTPAPYSGIIASAIFQINKTNGNVTWWTWRSWLPATYNGIYGSSAVHSAAQTLWVDNDTNGYIYPVYTNGWVQKITKNDVNATTYDANFWIRGLTNFWNYVADVPKNIWLSNETPYFNFKHWNQQGLPLNTSDPNLVGTLFRYSMLNTFNSFTAYEYTTANILGNSLFIDPVMQVAVTQKNAVQFFWNTAPGVATCTAARYGYVNLNGWYYEDRNCHYTEVPANAAGYNIGTTINGTFITGVVYSLIKTKFWEYYPITKYYGSNNWAWASWYNQTNNQQLGFTTKFGSDQEDVYSDNYGRAVLFTNSGAVYYYRPQFRADLNRKSDNYIFFKPQGGTFNGTSYLWGSVDQETQKVANPVVINLSSDESGSFMIGIYPYAHRINFTAQEPNLFNRTYEPVEIIFNATGNVRADCQDIIITDNTDTPISLWQVDNSTACAINTNISVWIMMNWTQNESKSLRLYYNGSSSNPTPIGVTDLTITTASGSCGTNNHEINVISANWYNWTRPAAAVVANEQTRYMFNDTTTNMWNAAAHYAVTNCYKSSNNVATGAGLAADQCGVTAVPVSRCLVSGGTGKIFAKLNATVAMTAIANRNVPVTTLNTEYYFFANTGRVRIRTQLNQSIPLINTTVSKNWPPYYYFSINGLTPPVGTNSWLYYSGLYEQMKRPIATFSSDMTEANLSSGPLPLMFTIKYGGFNNVSQANGSILRPASLDQNFWDKGCTAHKIWEYYSYTGGATYGAAAAPLYTSEFISCDDSLASQLPKLGQSGYVNVIPEMSWDDTTVNRWYDPTLIGKFYMMPNTYRPYDRENRLLAPYATATGAAGDSTPYALLARISSYIIPVCPEEQYGYKGYDDFLKDVPNLIANTALHITNNTKNIPCAVQIIKFTDQRGSDGTHFIFARNLTVIVGETMSAGWTYPFNTFANGTYTYQLDGNLDMTFAQKSSLNAGYYGKYYFTYTPYNYVMDTFSDSGAPQFTLAGTPSTPTSATAAMYTTRYSYAPEEYYNKVVFDESTLWNKDIQNFTYYRNPCWLGRYDNIYGATAAGYPLYAQLSTPGWQTDLWGSANNAYSTTCPHSNYNLEMQDTFRPAWGSKVPAAGDAAAWNELMIDGRENFAGNGTPPNAQDTYYVARHNALVDYKHSDDFNSILTDYNDLNQGVKQPNKQPWYCQISRHTNRSFCVMTNSLSTLIYNFAPGAGLTSTQGWSPYWSSAREAATFRNYYVSRYGDVAGWLMPYDYILDVTMYPTLDSSEVMTSNLLYTTANADDYQTFFRNQFPTAQKSLEQTQFLLKDWKNSAFIYFDQDSRQYASGLPMKINGIALVNGSILTNTNITLGIYDSQDTFIQGIIVTTNSSGMFNWSMILPANLSAGLNYVMINYSNQIADRVAFRTINLIATISSNKAAYEQWDNATTTILVENSYTGLVQDPDQLELRYINPSSQILECAKYPSSAIVSNCNNNLTKTGTGTYSYNISLGANPLGVYTQRATVTETGIAADFNANFVIALIDPCKANSLYAYALNYPMSYNNVTDVLTIIGNSTFGNASSPITFENMYEYSQAVRGTCIIDKPSTGSYSVKSRLVIGNGTQTVYVSSRGETISFSSQAMPQLTVNTSAHIAFGATVDGISQEGSNIKFKTNQTNDILLDIAGGELAFYDCYVGDVGNYWGRFMYRGSCGQLAEESSTINSSIIIEKTTFDRASRGQFFFTGNVTIDDMKVNRVNSSSSEGYGMVIGCAVPILNNIQIYHQSQNGSGIFVSNNTQSNTNLIIQNSFLGNNTKDVVATVDGKGVTLVNTEWDRTYGFNWTGTWTGTTSIEESYSYIPTFLDPSSQGVENVSVILLDRLGNVQLVKKTNSTGEIPEQYVNTWEVDKTISTEIASSFNPYTSYVKKYGTKFLSEPKLFTTKKIEIKQILVNPFTTKSESQASSLSNITYNVPTQVVYGTEYNNTWTTTGQLRNYPVDQCQYFALFANDTKLNKDVDYTINYQTGAITFLQDFTGYTIYPVYFYGGNITITNGFTLTNAFSMNDVYDYTQYQTSQNNLTEDVYTIDGSTYNFCVNLVIGNATTKGSLSDSGATLAFKDGYAMTFDGLGGFVDLAGITAGGGSNGGLPLNIFDNIGSNYAPGNTAYLFSTVMNSQGNLVDATVSISTYYPNGTLFSIGSSTRNSLGRFEYNITLPSDAPTGTWLSNIDAIYSGTEVHDNVVFTVSNAVTGGGGGNGSIPNIQIDSPSSIDVNKTFGVVAFTRNSNGLLVNCDGTPLLTLKDLSNGSTIINGLPMSSMTTGQYNYTVLLNYQSTFLASVSCSISSTLYISNPKIISTQNVASNSSGNSSGSGSGGSAYPTIDLSASTPIATSSVASIGALVKSSTGIPVNCDAGLNIGIKNLANGSLISGSMTNLGTGMYNYSWTTPPTAAVFYINASCAVSGTSYTGFTILSTQQVGATASIDYNTMATYVWNYTSRNLTYYNQSVSDSIQSCLKDAQCSGWWLNTTLNGITTTITQLNSTSNSIKNNTDILLTYFNCTQTNDMCTKLQNIINNVTDIQARVNSLNTSQIPALQTSVNNVYTDTQFIRANMATLSLLQSMNTTLNSMSQNMINQSVFDSNFSDLRSRLSDINITARGILFNVNCSLSSNSSLCSYLSNLTSSVNLINSSMATYSQVSSMNSNVSWIVSNVVTQSVFDSNMSDLRSRLNSINTTTQSIKTTIDCSNSSNSNLCTYLNNINTSVGLVYSNMATYSQFQNISNDTQWLKDNVATEESLSNNFSLVITKLGEMNSTLESLLITTVNISNNSDTGLLQRLMEIQTNLTWVLDNVATSSELNSNFTETFNRLSGVNLSLDTMKSYLYSNITAVLLDINQTTSNSTSYLYTNIANMLNELNMTTHNSTAYLYTSVGARLSELNITNSAMYNYLISNLSIQLNQSSASTLNNLTAILGGITSLQSDILFVKNNMFYQGNATGSFLVDYASSVYTQPGAREDLWISTRDLLGNDKTVTSAECYIMKQDTVMYNATIVISSGGVHAYWDIAPNETDGEYYWNCTLTGSIMNLQVPFYVSNVVSDTVTHDFTIDSLTAGSPRYPNEEALIEATFTNENGTAIDPDEINLTLYTSNGNVWTTATKQNFSKNSYNIWTYAKDIESNPTTGMYSVYMMASYNGMTSSKSVQFRIATGGPYKVYLDCPTTSYTGQDLICNVILKDEGEAATESISTVWVDENNNGVLDAGEPQASFSKRTVAFQNVSQPVAINVPSTKINGLYNVRVDTSYVNSDQPDSESSDSVLFSAPPPDTGTTGETGTGASSTGGGNDQIVLPPSTNGTAGTSAGAGQSCSVPDKFRDAMLTVLDDYKTVTSDSKILAELTVYNLGSDGMKEALVKYCIKTESGEIVKCTEENVTISTKTQLIKELLISKDMSDGKYYLSAQVSYDNKTVSSETTFTVKSLSNAANKETPGMIKSSVLNMIYGAVSGIDFYKAYMIILTILVAALLILLYRNKVKSDKEKSSENVRERSRESYAEHIKDVKEKSSEISLNYSGGLSLTKPPGHAHEKSLSEEAVIEDKKLESKKSESVKDVSKEISKENFKDKETSTKDKDSSKDKEISKDKESPKNKDVSKDTSKEVPASLLAYREEKSVASETKSEIKTELKSTEIKSIGDKSSESAQLFEKIRALLYITSFEDKAFVLSNNKRLRSIKDLLDYLPTMPEDVFNHHTKEGRNDFANWIKGVFEDKELAKLVAKSEDIDSLIITLKDYFRL